MVMELSSSGEPSCLRGSAKISICLAFAPGNVQPDETKPQPSNSPTATADLLSVFPIIPSPHLISCPKMGVFPKRKTPHDSILSHAKTDRKIIQPNMRQLAVIVCPGAIPHAKEKCRDPPQKIFFAEQIHRVQMPSSSVCKYANT